MFETQPEVPQSASHQAFLERATEIEDTINNWPDENTRRNLINAGITELDAMLNMNEAPVVFSGTCMYPRFNTETRQTIGFEMREITKPLDGQSKGVASYPLPTADGGYSYIMLHQVNFSTIIKGEDDQVEPDSVPVDTCAFVGLRKGHVLSVKPLEDIFNDDVGARVDQEVLNRINCFAGSLLESKQRGHPQPRMYEELEAQHRAYIQPLERAAKLIGRSVLISTMRAYTIEGDAESRYFRPIRLLPHSMATCLGLVTFEMLQSRYPNMNPKRLHNSGLSMALAPHDGYNAAGIREERVVYVPLTENSLIYDFGEVVRQY